jgi:hypothetical protein
MIEWLRKRSLPVRILVYAVAATLAFAVAAGVGATVALMVQGDLGLPTREEPRPSGEQGDAAQRQRANADQSQQEGDSVQQRDAALKQDEAEYASKVGDIQNNSVVTFLDSHNKLLRYDALTAKDVEDLQANQAALEGFTTQVDDLSPPQEYEEQYEVFRSAVKELHEATQLAYSLAADPTAATQYWFDEYDRHVNEAAVGLQRSNAILGRDYKTIEGVQRVNPLS